MRRAALVFSSVLLSSACTSERRLEASWTQFQQEYEQAVEHTQKVEAATVERARASGDTELLVAVTNPPSAPMARLIWASTLAGLAYFTADVETLERARAAVAECERDVSALEREQVP